MFHVKLFAETEAAEKRVEHIFDPGRTGEPIESDTRMAQLLRCNCELASRRGTAHREGGILQQTRLPPIDRDRVGGRK
jgi:hypothetical protein